MNLIDGLRQIMGDGGRMGLSRPTGQLLETDDITATDWTIVRQRAEDHPYLDHAVPALDPVPVPPVTSADDGADPVAPYITPEAEPPVDTGLEADGSVPAASGPT